MSFEWDSLIFGGNELNKINHRAAKEN